MKKPLILTTLAAVWLVAMSAHGERSAPPAGRMTEKELTQLYLDIVEEAVDVFEPLWTDDSKRIPNSGFYDFRKYDDWTPSYKGYAGIITIPGNGLVDFCYAILLTETDKPYFGAKKIPRSVLLDRALMSIRWCCLTSVYVKNHYPYIYEDTAPQFLEGRFWRRDFGYRADEVGFLTLAAAKLWGKLDAETRGIVEEVLIGGAPKERFLRTWEPPQAGNQDQVKQDLSSTIGAAFLFPDRPDQKLYWNLVALDGLDMVSTLHDYASPTVVEGKPVREWAKGWNLYQDYTSDHHGWAQVWYGCDKLFEGWFYVDLLSRLSGRAMPETYTYAGNGFEGVLDRMKILCLPEGEPASVHGMEYDSYYGSGLLSYLYGAVKKKDPVASSLEEKAALLLQRNSRAIHIYDYHRNNWAKAALGYLTHRYGGGRAEPLPFDKAWTALSGTFHHPWWQNLLERDSHKLASFAWGTISSRDNHFGGSGNGVCGQVIPARLAEASPEPLVYIHPYSLTGEIEVTNVQGQKHAGPMPSDFYRYVRDETQFHTAGRVTIGPVEQRIAFFSFAEGPCLFINMFKANESAKLTWSGIPFYFYARPGATSSRRYVDASGERKLEQPYLGRSDWWCVNDVLGAVILNGTGQVEVRRTIGRNWARTDAYKDKCDTVFATALPERELKSGDLAGDVAAVFFAEQPHAAIEEAARIVRESALILPDGWRGWVIPGGNGNTARRHLAVANLDAETGQAQLSLTFAEGAPVLSLATVIQGKSGLTPVTLNPFGTFGETIDAYAECLSATPVEARRLALGRYSVKPVFGKTARFRLRLAHAAGPIQLVDRQGKLIQGLPSGPAAGEGFTFEIGGEVTIIDSAAISRDQAGPAVEIGDIVVREDGRTTIPVLANDQSGIGRVRLFMDGKEVLERTAEPWSWTVWPGKGYHTFQAMAQDNSPRHNERKSDAVTVEIR